MKNVSQRLGADNGFVNRSRFEERAIRITVPKVIVEQTQNATGATRA